MLTELLQELQLHHLYRAMRWLGETKDQIEERLFQGRWDLFIELSLAFFDTTRCRSWAKTYVPRARMKVVSTAAFIRRPCRYPVWRANWRLR